VGGEIDWRLSQVVTEGRQAEAYAVLLSKEYVRKPTSNEYKAKLDLFGIDEEGLPPKLLATGTIDLTELLGARRVDGRSTQAVQLHGRGGSVLGEVDVTFEVNWSPYTSLPFRPAFSNISKATKRDNENVSRKIPGGLLGDLARDSLTYLAQLNGGAFFDPNSEVQRDIAGETLFALGCRPTQTDLNEITRGLPDVLPARDLAVALGRVKEESYDTARRSVLSHIASRSTLPMEGKAVQAAMRALRLHQDEPLPLPPPPARIRKRTATSHDVLAAILLKTAADVQLQKGAFLPLVNLPAGEVSLDEARFRAHELRKLRGVLAEAKNIILRMG